MNRLFSIIPLAAAVFSLDSCGKDEESASQKIDPVTITIDTNVKYQTIAGFGGANRMWGTQFLKPTEAKKAFGSDNTDLGMSIFRVRIASNDDEWPLILESVKQAQKYGAKILASPWSPPAALKNNGSDIGGHLLPENYEAFKDHINAFLSYMNTNGVEIYAISIQNEPDITVSYESCDWLAPDMIDFISEYGSLINARVAAPESYNFNSSYTNAILGDADATQHLDIVAGHIYGSGLGKFPLAESQGKEIWMTEYLMNLNTGNAGAPAWTTYSETDKWNETLLMLRTVHESMSNNWNAYIWWYLQRYYSFIGDGEQGTSNGAVLKRGWAYSQYSKFVRPGYVRVDASSNRVNTPEVTAYEANDEIVVVLLNRNNYAFKNLRLEIPSAKSAVSYETTVNVDRLEKTVQISDGDVVLSILPGSITTVIIKK